MLATPRPGKAARKFRGMCSSRILLLACVLATAAASCNRPEDKASQVLIGLDIELSGDIPTIGQSTKNAAELFFTQLNTSGGLQLADGPRQVKLVIKDNAANATQAASAAQHLILRDNVVAIIGPNSGNCADAASGIAETLKCVMISPWSPNMATTIDPVSGAPKRYVFRAGATDELQGNAMAKFALEKLGVRKAAIIEGAAPGGAAQVAAFKEAFVANGGTITSQETFTASDADFARKMTLIAATAPDVVFLAAPCDDSLPILKAAKEVGLHAKFLGTEAWNSPLAARLGELEIDGLYFCKNFDHRAAAPVAKKFVDDYTAKFHQPPDDVAALTYDACALVAAALQKSGRDNREALREALAQTKGFEGATGTFDFEPGSGDPSKSLDVLQIKKDGTEWAGDTGTPAPDKKIAPHQARP